VNDLPEIPSCRTCGEQAYLSCSGGEWSARCERCGKSRGPSPNIVSLVADWYDLVPAEKSSCDVEAEIKAILACSGSSVDWNSYLAGRTNTATAKRAMAILADAGVVSVKYFVDNAEVGQPAAQAAKSLGKKIAIFFRRSGK